MVSEEEMLFLYPNRKRKKLNYGVNLLRVLILSV